MGGLSSARVQNSNSISDIGTSLSAKKTGIVYSVILDETHSYSKKNNLGSSYVGSIQFRTADNLSVDDSTLPIAHPHDKNFKSLPLKNEVVEIYDLGNNVFLYRRIGNEINPSQSADEKSISSNFTPKKDTTQKSATYAEVSETGISKTNQDNSKAYDGLGDYYKIQNGLHKLKLYEGDSLIESRFGQSIRLSGFNNTDKSFSPTLIIRNGENSENRKKDALVSVEENINTDGTIIAMTSGKYQLPFQPGTVDDKSKSDFETKPDSFGDYPTKLVGDQLLLNSGRIILSAKNGEMIFYSKKNYGFISDAAMSIDNKLGIDISVGDDINVVTADRDINLITGNGSIFLGSNLLEPMVKGQQLVDLLAELIDAITQQMYLTPSGPSANGPMNVSQFGSIKSKLNSILSQQNQTA
jgi:hypothetical protein